MTKITMLFLSTALMVTLVGTGLAQVDGITPEAVTENFYDKYLQLKIRGLPDRDQAYDLTRDFSREINRLFVRDLKRQASFIRRHPDEKPPWAEGDLFSSLFEGATSFKRGKTRRVGDAREIEVHLVSEDGTNRSQWTNIAVLNKFGRRWRITNILYKGKWPFTLKESHNVNSVERHPPERMENFV